MKLQSFMASIALAGMASAALAQDLEDRLLSCAGVAQQQERLACYDALSGAVNNRTGEAEPTGQFGLEHKTPEQVPEIKARVARIDKDALGKMVFTLDNGQTWQQKDSKPLIVHQGDEVLIERGALSAFYLSAGDNRRIQVARIR